jgi:hypothetical protein
MALTGELSIQKRAANNHTYRVPCMWNQYRRTLVWTQVVIAMVTCAAFVACEFRIPVALTFFAVMQIGGALGAGWGARIRARVEAAR